MAGIYVPHLKDLVVRPALLAMGSRYATEGAVIQVTGTALVESGGSYLKQISGPALGLWQMEPVTLHDIWNRWLKLPAQESLRVRLIDLIPIGADIERLLITDMQFGAMMCRCLYAMRADPVPLPVDAEAFCRTWKAFYNTSKGAGWIDGARVALFQQAIVA